MRSLAEFGATIVVAGNIPGRTQGIPSAIFTRISAGETEAAWRLTLVSVLIGIVALGLHNWLLKQSHYGASSSDSNVN